METVKCGNVILGMNIGWGGTFATSLSGPDLTFDLAVVTLTISQKLLLLFLLKDLHAQASEEVEALLRSYYQKPA